MSIKEEQEKTAEATRKALWDQINCYEFVEDDNDCGTKTSQNEWKQIHNTVDTITSVFKKIAMSRLISPCTFCARNGMQKESEICQKECPASPKFDGKLIKNSTERKN